MATRTREELERLFEAASELHGLIETYCEKRHAIDPKFPEYANIENIDEDGVTLTWEEHNCSCGGCSPDTETAYISIDALLDTDFEQAKAEKAERERKAKEEAQKRAVAAKAAQERRERQQLAELQKKYGGEAA